MNVPRHSPAAPSAGVILGGLVALIGFATAAVLLASDSDASTGRVALLFGLFGVVVPVLLASLKSDQAATQTNGTLDARIHDAVLVALANRAANHPQDRPADPGVTPPPPLVGPSS